MTATHKVKEVAFIGYPVKDMKRAKAFYETVLGLTSTHYGESDWGQWQEYDIGACTLALARIDGWDPTGGGVSVALEVENFDASIKKLKECGVSFTMEPIETGVCRMAGILDPEGNSLTIHKRM